MNEYAESAESLADILYGEAAVFSELADLAAVQRHALLAQDQERLHALAARAETLSTRFRLLEGERVRLEPGDAHRADDEGEVLGAARRALLAALGRLLRETAVSGVVFERMGDTVSARQAAVGGLLGAATGNTYRPDGRPLAGMASGRALSAEG